MVASSAKPDKEHENDPPGRLSGFVDLDRARVLVDPGAEWAQMVREAWRLQPDQFWTADLSGVDWQRAWTVTYRWSSWSPPGPNYPISSGSSRGS